MCKKFIIFTVIVFQFFIISYADYVDEALNNIELKQYGRTFVEDSIGSRLIRLETDYFGMAQSGSVENRIYSLEKMAAVNKSIPQFQEDLFGDRVYYSKNEKPNKVQQFFNNITAPFSSYGTVTGYTPPIQTSVYGNSFGQFNDSYCPYHHKYNNHMNYNRLYHHPHPHIVNNYPYSYRPENTLTNIATRAAIKILD